MAHQIGVCSWSLEAVSPAVLADRVRDCQLRTVQLALDPLRRGDWDPDETAAALDDAGIAIASGMMAMAGEDYTTIESIAQTGGVRPDERWDENLDAARANAEIAKRLGIGLVSFHAGVIPDGDDPEREKIIDRLGQIAAAFAEQNVRVALETGQEPAKAMLELLAELEEHAVGVNFDPANMLLYGSGEPVDALSLLGPHVAQAHLKDANPPPAPGQWGTEVPLGAGGVDWDAFFGVLEEQTPDIDLIIERESGEQRVADVVAARDLAELYGAAR